MKARDKVCEALLTALELEEKGKRYYQQAAQKCRLMECRQIFAELADDEDLHQKRIRKIYGALSQGGAWCDWRELGQPHEELEDLIFVAAQKHGKKITARTTDLKALEHAIDLEAEAVKFYAHKLAGAADGREKEFYTQMLREERGHHRVLSDLHFYLHDPSGWFLEKEKAGLDGA